MKINRSSSQDKPLGCKYIFEKRMKVDVFIDKHEAKLMVNDYKQKQGFDHFNIYSSITRITSTYMLIDIVALNDLEIYHMNFKAAFLNRELDK